MIDFDQIFPLFSKKAFFLDFPYVSICKIETDKGGL